MSRVYEDIGPFLGEMISATKLPERFKPHYKGVRVVVELSIRGDYATQVHYQIESKAKLLNIDGTARPFSLASFKDSPKQLRKHEKEDGEFDGQSELESFLENLDFRLEGSDFVLPGKILDITGYKVTSDYLFS